MHHEHGTKPGFDLLRMWRMKFTSAAPVVLGFRETVLHYGIGMVKYSQNMSALQPFFSKNSLGISTQCNPDAREKSPKAVSNVGFTTSCDQSVGWSC